MNSKMTTNSQLSNEPEKKKNPPNQKPKQIKQTIRTGTESEMRITWSIISREVEAGEKPGEKVQRIRSIIGKYQIGGG